MMSVREAHTLHVEAYESYYGQLEYITSCADIFKHWIRHVKKYSYILLH